MPMATDSPQKLHIDVAWDDDGWPDAEEIEDTASLAANAAFAASQGEAARKATVAGAELSLVFTSNSAIRALNREWRGRDVPTNVLSFPAMDALAPGGPVFLGDVILARETVVSESEEQNKPLLHHIAHLVCHGTLHLLQYDHMTDNDAEAMESLETTILAGLGIDNPYYPVEPL